MAHTTFEAVKGDREFVICPKWVDDEAINLPPNAIKVLEKRYLRKDMDGSFLETPAGMFYRVARSVAKAEKDAESVDRFTKVFYDLMTERRFYPNSPTFTGAGTPLGQLAACQPYWARVVTEKGLIPIGELVEEQFNGAVDGLLDLPDEASGYVVNQRNKDMASAQVAATAYNGYKRVTRFTVLGGLDLDVTPDHQVYAAPLGAHAPFGWHKAEELTVGWKLLVDTREKAFSIHQCDDFTESLAAIVGWLQTDGYFGWPDSASSPIVEFETINGDEFDYVQNHLAQVPVFNAYAWNVIEENTIDPDLHYRRLRGYGKAIYNKLLPYGLSNRKDAKRVPEIVFRSPKRVVASYLRSIFQADSCVSGGTIQLGSVSLLFLKDIQSLLLQFGIVSRVSSPCHREGRLEQYKLLIGCKTDRLAFAEDIGFVSQKKIDLLKKLNQSEGRQRSKLCEVEIQKVMDLGEMPVFDIQTATGNYLSNHIVVHNCFVLGIEDDMGKDEQGIFSTLRTAALIQQTGGGNGFSFSKLRPKGDVVHASSGKASGPVGFLHVYDAAFGEIAQGGTRRGANMAVLRVDHPDIEEFIACKAEEGKISNFNISVAITDEFMHAVRDDKDFDLCNPRDGKVWKTVKARSIFDKIVEYAHRNGEPGVLFIDAANRSNPVPHLYSLEATNP